MYLGAFALGCSFRLCYPWHSYLATAELVVSATCRGTLNYKCGRRGVPMLPLPTPPTCFSLSFVINFFSSLSAIFFLFKEKYWESPICCSDFKKHSQKHFLPYHHLLSAFCCSDFKKHFTKAFFCPTTAYSRLCSSDHPCMKNLSLVGFRV